MRAMILAAGRGERMGDLTKEVPKPLIKVAKKYLIEYSISSLIKMGIKEIIINICHHRDLIKQKLGDGTRYGVKIFYSEEETALETGGGIYHALPLLGDKPFLVMSSDIITQFPMHTLLNKPEKLAHIVLVNNPSYHADGDFVLQGKEVNLMGSPRLTFANICVLKPEFFEGCKPGHFRLGELLKKTVSQGQVTGEHYQGLWFNVGTPGELAKTNEVLDNLPVDHS